MIFLARHVKVFLQVRGLHAGCPRQDSNLRAWLRRPLLYPLSYGGQGSAGTYHPRRPVPLAADGRQLATSRAPPG